MSLYQEHIMDHYRNPRGRKSVAQPDFASAQHNPSCGDSIAIEGKFKDGRIVDIGFSGSGCVISQAAASMLMQLAGDKSADELNAIQPSTMKNLLGIELGPMRLKCALLPLETLSSALISYATQS